MKLRPRPLVAAMLAVLAMSVPANELPDLGDSAVGDLPLHEERRIADEASREIRRSGDVLDDPEVDDYLQRLGYKLVAASNDNRINFRFFPIRDGDINAWAIPGGVIGINAGLIVLSQHESELAAVMAHEIAHITQHHYARMLESQKGSGWLSLGTLALAILAASRSTDSEAPMAAMAASEGFQAQRYLAFSRDFEREADRAGMQTLQAAGFDMRAMPSFFDRMQKYYRNVDNGAFAFLRTHPVTGERISDSEARAAKQAYKQWPDSADFLLVREKLRTLQLGAQAAVDYYRGTTEQRKYASEAAQQYGYASALLSAGRTDEAWRHLEAARKALAGGHPMLESLAGAIRLRQERYDEATAIFAQARARFPSAWALGYGEIDVMLRRGRPREAVTLLEAALAERGSDAALHKRLAEAYEQLGQPGLAHRAQAEYYALRDELTAAIEQLNVARRSGGDFYQMSAIEARIKELRARMPDDRKGKRSEPAK
ncbi:M48 family metallopeptidase [Chitinimonas arctica]|uniref:M48 family metallopeptidase n=1 Tax=Chitinimonas arctica TaxID=2594795 RepID=A0A516SHV0_9NEIS|nr:M48 family metalloprotease [Chitinimonas arctica]QDQ27628.1 M48 family metallopeptidase [Chitinimonas arctica]